MSVLQKTVSAGLIATTLAIASVASSAPAAAHGRFWGGFAAGAVGGIIGGALAAGSQPYYGRPVYYYPDYLPPPRPRYCHMEWRHDYWGRGYRVEVCPR